MGFNYLFVFPPGYVALCGSKARRRLSSESVSWCLETSLDFKTPFPGPSSVPTSFVSLFIFYIFSYLFLKRMGCFSGCVLSSAGIQKLFCGIYSVFKCSFDKYVGEKVVSPSYSSAILGPSPFLNIIFIVRRYFLWNWSQTETLFFHRNVNNNFNFMSYGEHNFSHRLTDCHNIRKILNETSCGIGNRTQN